MRLQSSVQGFRTSMTSRCTRRLCMGGSTQRPRATLGAKAHAPGGIGGDMLRVLSRLPLASLGGCALAVAASVALFVRGPAVDGTTGEHLFAGFAIFAVLGLWIDWARLYPTSRRTVLVSGGALVAT